MTTRQPGRHSPVLLVAAIDQYLVSPKATMWARRIKRTRLA
jgi:hypothetical protein